MRVRDREGDDEVKTGFWIGALLVWFLGLVLVIGQAQFGMG